ncbi:MAG: putative aminohydrolase SsnA [Chloroflexota bacterium]
MTLIKNATVVTWGKVCQVLTDYGIYIADGLIADMGSSDELVAKYPDAEQIDAGGQVVMPGNICAHTHFYGAYARGMGIPGDAPKDFPEVLNKLWWQLDKALDEDAVRASAQVFMVDAIKHGTTTLIDHHASPNALVGSLDVIADEVEKAGLRAVLCYEVTDRNGKDEMRAGIEENLRFMNAAQDRNRLAGTFGLHASLSLDDDTLTLVAEQLPAGAGVHVHVAEHEADEDDSLQRSGKRVVHRLHDYGLLGPQTIAAHCVHIDDDERMLLAETGTWVSHQPRSNMNNGVGAMDLSAMLDGDVKLALGNDGFSCNMFAEWKAAYFLHKVTNRDPREANGADLVRIATVNNARLAEVFFPELTLGEIVVGAAADLVFVDYQPFTPMSGGNMPWHVLFGFEASMITTTIVGGDVLMRDRELLTVDEAEVAAAAMAHAPGVWERYMAYAEQI